MKYLPLFLISLALVGISCEPAQEIACAYNGTRYEVGESFQAEDGCNTCTCGADGQIVCTEIACVNPVDECQTADDCLDQGIDTSFCSNGNWSCINAMCEFSCDLGI